MCSIGYNVCETLGIQQKYASGSTKQNSCSSINVAYEYPILGFVEPVMSVSDPVPVLSLLFGILFAIKCPGKQHSTACFDINACYPILLSFIISLLYCAFADCSLKGAECPHSEEGGIRRWGRGLVGGN